MAEPPRRDGCAAERDGWGDRARSRGLAPCGSSGCWSATRGCVRWARSTDGRLISK